MLPLSYKGNGVFLPLKLIKHKSGEPPIFFNYFSRNFNKYFLCWDDKVFYQWCRPYAKNNELKWSDCWGYLTADEFVEFLCFLKGYRDMPASLSGYSCNLDERCARVGIRSEELKRYALGYLPELEKCLSIVCKFPVVVDFFVTPDIKSFIPKKPISIPHSVMNKVINIVLKNILDL